LAGPLRVVECSEPHVLIVGVLPDQTPEIHRRVVMRPRMRFQINNSPNLHRTRQHTSGQRLHGLALDE
jgi:hypothetical protein